MTMSSIFCSNPTYMRRTATTPAPTLMILTHISHKTFHVLPAGPLRALYG